VISKYDINQDPLQWLRCYALAIANVGGNNDTKCIYFPFCLDQAPLSWLESLDKNSIDKWDQLKAQFTSNFAGAMGRLGTRMDLARSSSRSPKPSPGRGSGLPLLPSLLLRTLAIGI
jgi:hypothetical protein